MGRFLPLFLGVLALLFVGLFQNQIYSASQFLRYANSPTKNELDSKAFVDRILSSDGKFDPLAKQGVWDNKPVSVPGLELISLLNKPVSNVLGDNAEKKWIEIDLTTQHIYAHEGNNVAFDFPISSGLPWTPTVTGEFYIWAKVKSQRMTGGSVVNGSYYDLPNVVFVQYFHNGYGIHGAYWHNDFGHPRSHGCVNISNDNAKRLFDWTEPTLGPKEYARYMIKPEESIRVVVHGVTPTQLN